MRGTRILDHAAPRRGVGPTGRGIKLKRHVVPAPPFPPLSASPPAAARTPGRCDAIAWVDIVDGVGGCYSGGGVGGGSWDESGDEGPARPSAVRDGDGPGLVGAAAQRRGGRGRRGGDGRGGRSGVGLRGGGRGRGLRRGLVHAVWRGRGGVGGLARGGGVPGGAAVAGVGPAGWGPRGDGGGGWGIVVPSRGRGVRHGAAGRGGLFHGVADRGAAAGLPPLPGVARGGHGPGSDAAVAVAEPGPCGRGRGGGGGGRRPGGGAGAEPGPRGRGRKWGRRGRG